MTFDENAKYIEENYDPSDYDTYDHFISDIYTDYQTNSNNPDVLGRQDIQDFINALWNRKVQAKPEMIQEEEILEIKKHEDILEFEREQIEYIEEKYKQIEQQEQKVEQKQESIITRFVGFFRKLFR